MARKRSKYYLYVIILLFGKLLFSCEQEGIIPGNNDDNSSPPTGEFVTVNFTVSENNFSPITLRKRDAPSNSPEGRVYYPSDNEEGILISSSSGNIYMHAILKEEVTPVTLRASKLIMGTKVRVVAYEDKGLGYIDRVGSADYTTATDGNLLPDGTPPLTVTSGSNYRFVAYSYNNTDAMPTFADTTAAIGSVDLIWGENTVLIGPGNNSVYILLEHLFSQVKLHAVLNHAVGDYIFDLDASVSHTIPKLDVMTPDLVSTGSSAQIPFAWPDGAGFASNWYSKNLQIFTDGSPPVVTVGSVNIDGTPYYGPFPSINYTTPLAAGYEYTLYLYFTTDGILCGNLESPPPDTWGNY